MLRYLIMLMLFLGLTGAANAFTGSADLDAPEGCFSTDADDCIGGLYSLDVVSTAIDDRYLATITMDFSGVYDLDFPAEYVSYIEFKVAGSYDPDYVVSGSGPTNFVDDGSAGFVQDGPLSGGGCNGNNSGFLCIQFPDAVEIIGDSLSWTVEFGADGLLDEEDWHLGALFTWESVKRNGSVQMRSRQLSLPAPPIPEPASAALFAVGGLLVGAAVRRPL